MYLVSFSANQVVIDSEPNVFIEELHKTADQPYSLFVPDNSQMVNFIWKRESGIRIFIHVSSKYALSQYIYGSDFVKV